MPSCKHLARIPLAVLFASLLFGALPAAADLVYVATTTADVVSVIDTVTNGVLGTIPVGDSPARVAVTPDGARAYVTNTDSDSVSVIDTTTHAVVATVPVAAAPSAVAVTPDGADVYVLAGGVLQVLDTARIGTATNPVIATISFGSPVEAATSIALLPDGTRAYALVAGALRVIDTATHAVLRSLYVGTSPSQVAISPDGTRAYVTNAFGYHTVGFDGQVVVVDTATDTVLTVIPLLDLPASIAITPDGTRAYVAIVSKFWDTGYGMGFLPATDIAVIDLVANVLSHSILVPGTPAGVAITPDGRGVYVALPRTNSIAVIDGTTDSLATAITVAAGPSGLAIAPAPAVVACENGTPCDDGNACTTGDTCAVGFCGGGAPLDCNDGNPCTTDSCTPASGCVHTNNTAPCTDGNACTTGDACAAGTCRGNTPARCNDGNPCTTDTCNPAGSCVNTPNTAPCTDGNACTTGDTCAAGACRGGPAPTCNDGNPCTNDSCSPATGCVNAHNVAPCDDGNTCTTSDVCVNGTCVGTLAPDCSAFPLPAGARPAYVATTTADVVSVIDTVTNGVLGTIPVGDSPARVAVTPDGARAYVTNTDSDSVSVIDTTTHAVVATVPVAAAPSAVAVTPDGADVYVLAGGVLQVLDTARIGTATNPVIATISFGSPVEAATSIALLPDGTRAYALVAGALRVIDTATHAVLRSLYVGTSPSQVAISPDGTRAYVTNAFGYHTVGFDGQVVVVDTATDTVLTVIPLLDLPASIAITPDGTRAYVAIVSKFWDTGYGMGFLPATDIAVIDLVANVLSHSILVPGTPAGVAITPDGRGVYVALPETNSIAVIDGTTDSLATAIAVAAGPSGLAIAPVPAVVACENGTPCDDGNACTTGDTCAVGTPASGCIHTNNTAPCTDGNACTTGDTCAASACRGGPAPSCNDANPCTADSCTPASGCVNTPNTAACTDGNACTTGDTCAAGACRGGPAPSCNDANPCTADSCTPASGCVHTNSTAACDDANPCTTDSCNPASGCVHANNSAACTDGNACTTGDTCAAGSCRSGPPLICDDGDMCNGLEACDPQVGCRVSVPTACADAAADVTVYDEARTRNFGADPALWADTRTAKRTFLRFQVTGTGIQPVLGATLRLRVANASDAPSDSGGRIRQISNCSWAELLTTWNTQPVIDGPVLDTVGPVGSGDRVEFDVTSVIAGDGLYCFVLEATSINGVIYDSSETATGPRLTLTLDAACTADGDCDDGIHCNGVETCAAGVCRGGPAPTCDDGNPCTTDSCTPASGCVHTNNTAPCTDGNPCTTGDTCAAGACRGGPAPICDDGNPCTTDSCTPASGCVHTNNTAPCTDGNACTTGDTCAAGVCRGGPAPTCNDGNPCTTDSCNPASGCVNTPNTASCHDGDACTTGDTCAAGSCRSGPPLVCDDGDMCNGLEACDPQTGQCRMTTAMACADAAADVTVYDEARTRNFGADPALWADTRTAKRTFLRFQVTGTGIQPVLGATLHLRVANASDAPSDSGGRIRQISNCSWAELLTTWNTQPVIDGPVLDTVGPVGSGDRVEFDVTSVIAGDGLYCFVLEATSINGVIYDSSETATGPRLTLTLDAACTADGDCDDGIHCNGVETCAAGVCRAGATVDCSTLTDVCNDGACDETSATCVRRPRPNGTSCDDGDRCNGLAACNAQTGLCVPGMPVPCTDGNACNGLETCNPQTGQCLPGASIVCTDGNACNGLETCNPQTGQCLPGNGPACNDGNPCTTDSCTPAGGCVHTNNTAPCDDGNTCTTGDRCAGGTCQIGAPLVCNDAEMCNGLEACHPQTGQCRVTVTVPDGTSCDDDDLCNGLEACDAASGQCQVSQAVLCEVVEADVTVFQTSPRTPLGAQSVLWADADTAKHTFLRVSANGVGTATVVSAMLRLHVATVKDAESNSGGRIRRISACGWNELTTTWNTRPAIDGPVLDEVGAVAAGDEMEFDITAGISGDGPHCFAIESRSSDGVVYSSRETARAPEVEIVLDRP